MIIAVWIYCSLWLAGYAVLSSVEGAERSRSTCWWARAWIAGPFVVCSQFVAYGFAGLPTAAGFLLWPWWGVVAWLGYRRRALPLRVGPPLAVHAVLAVVTALLFAHTVSVPILGGDAMYNFGLAGRAFHAAGSLDFAALEALTEVGRQEYPPLVGLTEGLFFNLDPVAGAAAAKGLFALWFLAVGGLIVEVVWVERVRWLSLAAVIALVLAPKSLWLTEHAFGELPLVAAWLWLLREVQTASERRSSGGALVLAAAACAWTKNEGLVLGGVGMCALARIAWRRGSARTWLAVGVAGLLLALWPVLKWSHGLSEQFLTGAAENGGRLERLPAIAGWFGHCVIGPVVEPMPGVLGRIPEMLGVWMAGLVAVVLGWRSPGVRWLTLGWVLHVGLYAAVFVVTPHDVQWHLETAADRLLYHTMPWVVLLVGHAVRQVAESEENAERRVVLTR